MKIMSCIILISELKYVAHVNNDFTWYILKYIHKCFFSHLSTDRRSYNPKSNRKSYLYLVKIS